jgi:hypothetical protein
MSLEVSSYKIDHITVTHKRYRKVGVWHNVYELSEGSPIFTGKNTKTREQVADIISKRRSKSFCS